MAEETVVEGEAELEPVVVHFLIEQKLFWKTGYLLRNGLEAIQVKLKELQAAYDKIPQHPKLTDKVELPILEEVPIDRDAMWQVILYYKERESGSSRGHQALHGGAGLLMTKVVFVATNVAYLPAPNTVEIVLSEIAAPSKFTATAFVLPVRDGKIVMAHNLRRGIEVPGGHVEAGETLEQAARREAWEEVGVKLGDLTPIGYLRMNSFGDPPDDYKYPHPLSFQQFFAGRVEEMTEFAHTDECGTPVEVLDLEEHRPSVQIFGQRASRTTFLTSLLVQIYTHRCIG
jgi:8-oxo-dGTP diphosphatase